MVSSAGSAARSDERYRGVDQGPGTELVYVEHRRQIPMEARRLGPGAFAGPGCCWESERFGAPRGRGRGSGSGRRCIWRDILQRCATHRCEADVHVAAVAAGPRRSGQPLDHVPDDTDMHGHVDGYLNASGSTNISARPGPAIGFAGLTLMYDEAATGRPRAGRSGPYEIDRGQD